MKFRVLILLFVLATAAIDATAQERLVPGKSTSGEVAPSSSRSYYIELRAGDYVRGSLAQRGQARLVIYLPDGEILRTSPAAFGDGRREFVFAAETAGRYRLDVVPGATSAVQFDLLVSAVIPLSGRVRSEPSLEPYPSSRIEALRRQVASGRIDTTAFWKEVALTGTPLIEPVGSDGKYQMVTFLWRERFETRNVLVTGTFQGPAGDLDNVMRRLPHTDVWYLTLKLQNGARFTYQLSPNDPLALEGPRAEERAATAQADPLILKDSTVPLASASSRVSAPLSFLEHLRSHGLPPSRMFPQAASKPPCFTATFRNSIDRYRFTLLPAIGLTARLTRSWFSSTGSRISHQPSRLRPH